MKQLIFIAVVLQLMFSGSLHAQEDRNSLNFGFGFPEFFFMEYQRSVSDWNLGLHTGFVPGEKAYAVGFSGQYHFRGETPYSSQPPWYFLMSNTFTKETSVKAITHDWWLSLRFGRVIYFNNDIGLQLDLGGMYNYYHWRQVIDHTGWDLNIRFHVLPSASAGIFFRF